MMKIFTNTAKQIIQININDLRKAIHNYSIININGIIVKQVVLDSEEINKTN